MSMDSKLSRIVEAIVFVSDHPVSPHFLLEVLAEGQQAQMEIDFDQTNELQQEIFEAATQEVDKQQLEEVLEALCKKYQAVEYPFEIRKVGGGYQFFSKKEYFPFVRRAALVDNKKKLSRVVMETLSIIAYRQPITKAEIEFIRGVNSDYAVQKLLDKKLVSIMGRSDAPGKPLLYGTSPFFMQYFGLGEMDDLPKLKEFESLAEEHMEAFRTQKDETLLEEGETPQPEPSEVEDDAPSDDAPSEASAELPQEAGEAEGATAPAAAPAVNRKSISEPEDAPETNQYPTEDGEKETPKG